MSGSVVESAITEQVPRAASLDAWASTDWSQGVDVTTLDAFDELTIRTRNSVYTITIVNPWSGEVSVRGGSVFPVLTTARLCGSSLGRGFLKRHVVHAGFCLELAHEELGLVVTTRVRSVTVSRGTDGPRPLRLM